MRIGSSIHLIGVGGVGMAALAMLLKRRGFDVSGCDCALSARTRWLDGEGVKVACGHDPAHAAAADSAVVTPAVPVDHPEVAAFAGRIRSRGEVLAEIVSATPDSVAVCGSHGKTTTATWTARLLAALGEPVEWAIGGETGAFPVAGFSPGRGAFAGKDPVLVVEADESDGTLALYRAKTLVVTCCDFDHPDHFPSRADYLACFDAARRAAQDVVESEALADDPALAPVLAPLAPHNRRNARAAAEVAIRRGHSVAAVAAALADVVAELPDRRFQKVAEGVWTDYAHHPAEIACAVAMARVAAKGYLRVLFQPHRHSRTRTFAKEFPAAFAGADEVVLCPVYAAFEPPVEGGDIADLYCEFRAAGKVKCLLAQSCAEAWEHAYSSAAPGDVTLLLGAGDIVDLVDRVRHDVAAGVPLPRRRVVVGAMTNTWRSDLNLPIDYVRAEGPAGRPGAEIVAARPRLCPWMAGIPGTVGGWVKMNAGAFGHSIFEVVDAVKVSGRWIPAAECGFGYRTSAIDGVIEDVRWKDDPPTDAEVELPESYLARRVRFPAGTYGSFFKNPPGDFAGRLLEAAGAKGMRVGGAYVWDGHANVIVRGEGATASDVLALARLMRSLVFFRFGVSLEPEVRGIDFDRR